MNFVAGDAANAVWTPQSIQAALQALGVVPAGGQNMQMTQEVASQQALWQQALEAHAVQQGGSQTGPQVVLPPAGRMGMGGGRAGAAAQEMQFRRLQKTEDVQKRQADLQAARSEEVIIREQHRAALVVRKMIQRVRMAKPDTIDELRGELEMVQAEQMAAMGPLAEKVQQEIDKALADVAAKVNEEHERQMEEHRKQIEEEMHQREEEARVDAMADEATLEVTEVETKVSHAEELALPIRNATQAESPEGLLEAAIVTLEAINSAQAELNVVAASMKEKWGGCSKNNMKVMQKLGPHFRNLHARLAVCRRTLTKLQETTQNTKNRVGGRVQALRKENEQKEAFSRHDTDGDGKLCREEIQAYALMEWQLDINTDQLDKLCAKLLGKDKGVNYQKLPQLHRILQDLQREAQAQSKKDEEARKRQELRDAMSGFTAVTDSIADILSEAEAAEMAARVAMKPLMSQVSKLESHRLDELVQKAEEKLEPASEKLEEALSRIGEVDAAAKADDGSKEMMNAKKAEVGKVRARARKLQDKLKQLKAAANEAQQSAARQTFAGLQRLRDNVVPAIRSFMAAEGLSVEKLFNQTCGSIGAMEQDQFVSLLRNLPDVDDFEDSQASGLFEHLAEGGSFISLERFTEFLKFFFKVMKNTMLTKGQPINSQVTCRLDAGDILELENGKSKDAKVGVSRVHCKSSAKKASGWVTVLGNQGTAFLQPVGLFFMCIKEAALTDVLKIQGSETLRNLEASEFVEALGPEEVDTSVKGSKVTRLKIKAKRDGMIGYVTIEGNQGTIFLVPC